MNIIVLAVCFNKYFTVFNINYLLIDDKKKIDLSKIKFASLCKLDKKQGLKYYKVEYNDINMK